MIIICLHLLKSFTRHLIKFGYSWTGCIKENSIIHRWIIPFRVFLANFFELLFLNTRSGIIFISGGFGGGEASGPAPCVKKVCIIIAIIHLQQKSLGPHLFIMLYIYWSSFLSCVWSQFKVHLKFNVAAGPLSGLFSYNVYVWKIECPRDGCVLLPTIFSGIHWPAVGMGTYYFVTFHTIVDNNNTFHTCLD